MRVTSDNGMLADFFLVSLSRAEGPDEFYAFSFAYNVVKDMVSTMRKKIDPQFELPKGFFIKEPVVPGQ